MIRNCGCMFNSHSPSLLPELQSFPGFAQTLLRNSLQWHCLSSQRSVSHKPETDFALSFGWFIAPSSHCVTIPVSLLSLVLFSFGIV